MSPQQVGLMVSANEISCKNMRWLAHFYVAWRNLNPGSTLRNVPAASADENVNANTRPTDDSSPLKKRVKCEELFDQIGRPWHRLSGEVSVSGSKSHGAGSSVDNSGEVCCSPYLHIMSKERDPWALLLVIEAPCYI